MPVTPSGFQSSMLDAARELVAASTTFQTMVGAASAAAAKAYVHLKALDGSAAGVLTGPFAVVSDVATEYPLQGFPRGRLALRLKADVSSANAASHVDANLELMNKFGAIISEMRTLSQAAGYLVVRDIKAENPQERSDKNEQTDYVQSFWLLEWGLSG